jgi:alpha-mannosidase
MADREQEIRERLGIPADVEKIIVFGESSHWDPNWLYTSEEYYRRYVRDNLYLALSELQKEPRRIYSLESVFFLQMFWEREPQQREAVRRLVNEGRLRLTSTGVTTADTLLPRAEAILRDLLLGQVWLWDNGMIQEPRLAYFTDSFGCSPGLPSLLRAAGFEQTAITRIDGAYFPGCDYEPEANFPRAGSSAFKLSRQERSLDFVWRGPDGAEVLCHWNAFNYGQGDLLAHRGLSRVYLAPFSISDPSDRNVARRIRQFSARLLPCTRTPYVFCPIGFDFVPPIRDLVSLLDRYNERHYARTGLWAVNAGLDDYLDLVGCHRERLPVLELDPNPYWTGFYTSRPTLKELAYRLVDRLELAEKLALIHGDDETAREVAEELREPWWVAVSSNHHDFITGTSPDRVVEEEQRPWLLEANEAVHRTIQRLVPAGMSAGEHPAVPATGAEVKCDLDEGRLRVVTPHYVVEMDQAAGGGIVRAYLPSDGGQDLLGHGVSNDVVSYRDSGGLWRMGHEFRGGRFRETGRASQRPARLEVERNNGNVEVSCETKLQDETIVRRLVFDANTPVIRMRLEGRAARRHTITVLFQTTISTAELVMDQPGGVVTRPPKKLYEPTFWPLQRFVHLRDDTDGHGLALFVRWPGAVHYGPEDGELETVALRNANREMAFGFLPLPATPARGHEDRPYAFDYALWFTPGGNWRDNEIPRVARGLSGSPWAPPEWPPLYRLAATAVTTSRSEVVVSAAKPASAGEGWIVRLYTLTEPGEPVFVRVPGRQLRAAWLCDARERDIEPLKLADGAAHLTMPGTIASVRLILEP